MASIGQRLYRGDLNIDFVGRAKLWYRVSAVVILICLGSILFRGFNFGIEFSGGNQFQFNGTEQQVQQVSDTVEGSGVEVASAQLVGSDQIVVRTPELTNDQSSDVAGLIADTVGIAPADVTNNSVSARWGGDITSKAVQSLIVFLVLVTAFIAIRFQPKMAVAALAALANDLIVAAGLYSLVGFEVTPSTVIGLLTILGFSLYDTVVVFDKVDENTRGILGGSRTTYSSAANLAVNQTLMRSINTSLIALLPVAGLLFVGAGLLGAGTLKDLALVLFVGLATGAYSSIFLATPLLCDLKEREPAYVNLAKRVQARQASGRDVDAGPRAAVSTAKARKAASRRPPPGARGGATAVLDRPAEDRAVPTRGVEPPAATGAPPATADPPAATPDPPAAPTARRSRAARPAAPLAAARTPGQRMTTVKPSGAGSKGQPAAAETTAADGPDPAAASPAGTTPGTRPAGKATPRPVAKRAQAGARRGKQSGKKRR